MNRYVISLLALIAMLGAMSMPAAAAKHVTLLYPTTIVAVFADAGGKTRTITQTIQIEPGYNCDDIASSMAITHPELKGMSLKSATCRDKGGNSAAPGGAASVRLFFIVDGHVKVVILDHLGTATFDMKTCSSVIQQQQAALVAEGERQAAGGKFVSANCMAKPKYMSTYTNSHN